MAEIGSFSTPVEARSLSSITSVASNPPAYPRNPTQGRLDRIELYIVKVPGSKDVVLTPLKPATKSNISIEAINSSLYYLHVVTEDDEEVLRFMESEKENQHQEDHRHDPSIPVPRMNNIHRKPIMGHVDAVEPSPPPLPPPHREGIASLSIGKEDQQPAGISQSQVQAVSDETLLYDSHVTAHNASSPISNIQQNRISREFKIPRRPISSSGTSTPNSPTIKTTSLNVSQGGQRFSYDGPRPAKENENVQTQLHLASEKASFDRGTLVTDKKSTSPFHIIVIRRDTASGNQWNVGTISSSKMSHGVIHIEISNPGYAKFINNTAFSAANMGRHHEGQTAAEILKSTQATLDTDTNGIRTFYRDVVPIKHGHHHGHSLSDALFNRRPGSAGSPTLANVVSAKVSRGYYSFKSPWEGTCSFVASVNGGSLKCKHVIPGPESSAEIDGGHDTEVTVAELRYNIPFALEQSFRPPSMINMSSHIKPSREKENSKRTALSQLITTNMEKIKQHTHAHSQGRLLSPTTSTSRTSLEQHSPSSAATDDEERLDFSLAREPGGGGMSGKNAKLGKLIIEDEGIKMIDLVVAASMGVWWRSSSQSS